MTESVEEFDRWLDTQAPPTPASGASAPAASDSGWFSSLGFSSNAAAPSSAPPSLSGLFSSVTSVVPSAAMAKFDGLLESAGPATSVFSSAFGGVADSLKAKYEESVEQYQREQARYCTEEAQRAERQQLAESLKHVQLDDLDAKIAAELGLDDDDDDDVLVVGGAGLADDFDKVLDDDE